MSVFYDEASLVLVPSGYKASKVYAQKPLTTDGQLTFSRASTATRVNASGLVETVASNVPRLDYLGSTCPKLQLEPQRQNLALYSSAFNESSYWFANNATITANNAVSPDGTSNADMYTATGSSNFLNGAAVSAGSNTITYSVFVKAGTQSVFRIREAYYFGTATIFNLSTGTVTSGTGTITNYGNGWYRCTHTQAYGAGEVNLSCIYDTTASTGTFYIYGAQFEVGAYATSYIPTTAAAVTRLADAASKTGISSLIGQTEGTLFMDFVAQQTSTAQSHIWLDTDIAIFGGTTLTFYTSGGVEFNGGTLVTGQRYKVAFGYKLNDFVAYVNGVQVGTDTSGTVPATSNLYLNQYSGGIQIQKKELNQALLFKTRLTNDQLAQLTAV